MPKHRGCNSCPFQPAIVCALRCDASFEPIKDFEFPKEGLAFDTLIRAQALGDFEALHEAKKKAIRVHLPSVGAVVELVKALSE